MPIIDPLEMLETIAGDGQRGSCCDRRESYSLQDVGLIMPQRLRMVRLAGFQMGFFVIGLQDIWQAQWVKVMVLQSNLPRFTEMFTPSLSDGFLPEQLVLFAPIHSMDSIRMLLAWRFTGQLAPLITMGLPPTSI